MDFAYIRDQYDKFNEQMFGSAFSISATVHIQGEESGQESIKDGMGRNIDGRMTGFTSISYPLDLKSSYRFMVYPIEASGLRLGETKETQHTFSARFSPYDRWLSIKREDVAIRNDSRTLMEFASHFQVGNQDYEIKGVVPDDTGTLGVIHVFLVKQPKG